MCFLCFASVKCYFETELEHEMAEIKHCYKLPATRPNYQTTFPVCLVVRGPIARVHQHYAKNMWSLWSCYIVSIKRMYLDSAKVNLGFHSAYNIKNIVAAISA
jgi:hypothetical protein